MNTAHLTDAEFDSLIGKDPLFFATRVRAESVAHDIRDRMAAVAADLRQSIMAGAVADALPLNRIAREFERLAHDIADGIGPRGAVYWPRTLEFTN